MVNSLSCGPPQTMLQNVVYALPACRARIFTETAATFIQSNTFAFTASTAVTLVEGSYEVGGAFIKCTSGDILVTLKKN